MKNLSINATHAGGFLVGAEHVQAQVLQKQVVRFAFLSVGEFRAKPRCAWREPVLLVVATRIAIGGTSTKESSPEPTWILRRPR